MKIVYKTNIITGEFIGNYEADYNPLDPENPYFPPECVEEPPPSSVDLGFVAVWNTHSNEWNYLEDNRGIAWDFEGNEVIVKDLGTLPNTLTKVPKPQSSLGFGHKFIDGEWVEIEDHRGETWYDAEGNPVIVSQLGTPLNLYSSKPIEVVRTKTKNDVISYIDSKCDLIKRESFIAEQQSWPIKLRDAENIINQTVTPLNSPLLVEATFRMSSFTAIEDKVNELAHIIVQNATLYRTITYIFTGYRTFIFAKIEEAENENEASAILEESKIHVDNIFNYTMSNNQTALNSYVQSIIST